MISAFWWTVSRAGQWVHNDVLQKHSITLAASKLEARLVDLARRVTVHAFARATGGQGKVQQVPKPKAPPSTDEGTW